MKVFNLTTGRKGELLADVGRWNGCGDGLVNGALIEKGTGTFRGYEFHNSFQAKVYGQDEVNYTPADFAKHFGAGVEAVCFCIGHNLNLDKWEWCFCASRQWIADHHVQVKAIEVDWENFSGDLSKIPFGPVPADAAF